MTLSFEKWRAINEELRILTALTESIVSRGKDADGRSLFELNVAEFRAAHMITGFVRNHGTVTVFDPHPHEPYAFTYTFEGILPLPDVTPVPVTQTKNQENAS